MRFDLVRLKNDETVFPFKYILSIDQIGDMLFFSGEWWKYPRYVNIKRDYTNFTEEDITLIKKPPRIAPQVFGLTENTNSVRKSDIFINFSYRYKYIDGDYSALSFYSDTVFEPKSGFEINAERENKGMVNKWDSVSIRVNSGGKNVTDIEVYAREHGSNTAYLIHSVNKKKAGIADNAYIANIKYSFSKNYTVLSTEETAMLYSNIPMYPYTQTGA